MQRGIDKMIFFFQARHDLEKTCHMPARWLELILDVALWSEPQSHADISEDV